jgi:ketosteroid isomerase-like protein
MGATLVRRPLRASDGNLSDACFHARPVAHEGHRAACRLGHDGHVGGQLLQRKRLPLAGMSQEGMERIRRAVDAFNRRDVDGLLEWNHPDIVYQTAIASMEGEGGVYHGHEGAREWLRDLDDAVEGLRGELDELYDLGDGRYLGAGRFHGRGRGSSAEFDVPVAWVYIAEGDLLVRFEAYFEREKALESLGLDRWPG